MLCRLLPQLKTYPITMVLFLILFSLPLLLNAIPSSLAQCNVNDRNALLQVKADGGNPPALSSWNTSSNDCCNWQYIDCEGTDRVQFIFAFYSNLTGPLSPALALLPNLTTIRLDGNSFTGPIPSFLTRLTSLSYLHLANNQLSGPIPDFLASLPLTLLQLNNNHFTGTIPAYLGHSSILSTLYLSHNSLTGTIPASFARSGIQNLRLESNKLVGDASLLFGETKKTMALALSKNRFEFNLSTVKFPTSLGYFAMDYNRVYGGIPQQINELKNLRYFNVSNNQLCGAIPVSGRLGRIAQLKVSDVYHNKCLCGSPLPACS